MEYDESDRMEDKWLEADLELLLEFSQESVFSSFRQGLTNQTVRKFGTLILEKINDLTGLNMILALKKNKEGDFDYKGDLFVPCAKAGSFPRIDREKYLNFLQNKGKEIMLAGGQVINSSNLPRETLESIVGDAETLGDLMSNPSLEFYKMGHRRNPTHHAMQGHVVYYSESTERELLRLGVIREGYEGRLVKAMFEIYGIEDANTEELIFPLRTLVVSYEGGGCKLDEKVIGIVKADASSHSKNGRRITDVDINSIQNLVNFFMNSLFFLSRIDDFTLTHSLEVRRISLEIGKYLPIEKTLEEAGFCVESINELLGAEGTNDFARGLLGFSAVLHDIGKQGIPNEILTYPGSYTNDKAHYRKIVSMHPEVGLQMILGCLLPRGYSEGDPMDLPNGVADMGEEDLRIWRMNQIANSPPLLRYLVEGQFHHVYCNGMEGYPILGWRNHGEKPSMISQIIAVADGFNARTKRRYQTHETRGEVRNRALSQEEALGDMQDAVGEQYCREAVVGLVQAHTNQDL